MISDEIRETVLENSGYTIEEFYNLEPHEFIQKVAEEMKCRSKVHFALVMLNCYGNPEISDFKKVVPTIICNA